MENLEENYLLEDFLDEFLLTDVNQEMNNQDAYLEGFLSAESDVFDDEFEMAAESEVMDIPYINYEYDEDEHEIFESTKEIEQFNEVAEDYEVEEELVPETNSFDQRHNSQYEFETEHEGGIVEHIKSLKNNMVQIAKAEYAKWNNGRLKENDPLAKPLLQKYWKQGVGISHIYNKKNRLKAWSAAFISYVVKTAGGHPPFKPSGAHRVYASKAKSDRTNKNLNNPISFWLYRINEIKPQVGDIIFNTRGSSKATYYNINDGTAWPTHSDIVIEVLPGKVRVVGGNKSDSVNISNRSLTSDGYLQQRTGPEDLFFGIGRFFPSNAIPKTGTGGNSFLPKKVQKVSLLDLLGKIGFSAIDFSKIAFSFFKAIKQGTNENKLTNFLFFYKYPHLKGKKLQKNSRSAGEWIKIRNTIVRPILQKWD